MRWTAMSLMVGLSVACSETGVNTLDEKSRAGTSDDAGDGNAPPEVTVVLRPLNVRTNGSVTAAAEATDPEGDPITVSYAFTVDGVTVQEGSETTLSGIDHFEKGQSIQAIATASDGTHESTAESNTVVVLNTPPTAPMVSIEEHEAGITCVVTEPANDDDVDPIDYGFVWDVDGVAFTDTSTTTYDADTVPGDALGFDELWTCTVTPNDGEEDGPSATATYMAEECPDAWFENDFNGETPTELEYNGDAYHDPPAGNVRLAGSGITYDNNVMYLKDTIPSDQFYVSFDTNMAGEGDGVALIISNDSDFTAHRPDQPYGIGGPTGYIVIFDTWSNVVDPGTSDFVAVYSLNETWPHTILVHNTSIPRLDDGVDHTFEITVNAGRILVDIDGLNYLDYDLPTLPDPEVMIGWGAHNGVMTGTKTVDNIVVSCRPPEGT